MKTEGDSVGNMLWVTVRKLLPHLPMKVKRHVLWWMTYRRPVPRNPQTFMEKVHWRITNDRREIIARGGDKVEMKKHAASACPSVLIPETLWYGDDLDSIADTDWGCEWVLKPISGAGYAEFGHGSLLSSGIDLGAVKSWRYEEAVTVQGEWAYSQARSGYLIERKIPTSNGDLPNDHRFFVFDGVVKLVQVDSPRFQGVRRRFYTPEWEPLEDRHGDKRLADVVSRPVNLNVMLRMASEIGAEYDFIRVDLYDTPDGIYFGEITPYPTGGLTKFSNHQFDLKLGRAWILPQV
ncbi:ATP-grasp fold amidoligase family protein [Kocuria sp. CPCC 205292]|uniref:ATP-grasp fold amidoligase family protein n=1 Tax=Kocuria cellulosilytica TaxID=3071451 RepID=UPI0034D6E493